MMVIRSQNQKISFLSVIKYHISSLNLFDDTLTQVYTYSVINDDYIT